MNYVKKDLEELNFQTKCMYKCGVKGIFEIILFCCKNRYYLELLCTYCSANTLFGATLSFPHRRRLSSLNSGTADSELFHWLIRLPFNIYIYF